MNAITLHHEKAAKTMSNKGEIFDYVFSIELLEILKQKMKLYLNYEVCMKHLEKNLGVYYKKLWYCFMKKFIAFRRNTHISHKLPENYFDKIQEFFPII